MPREVFVDASAWVAVTVTRDQYHSQAVLCYRRLLEERHMLVTTNLVWAETHVLIHRASGYLAAMRFLQNVRRGEQLVKVYSGPALESQAEAILRHYSDHDFSLTDAVSFAVMRERGISEAFAFDKHFATAGFTLVPSPPS